MNGQDQRSDLNHTREEEKLVLRPACLDPELESYIWNLYYMYILFHILS